MNSMEFSEELEQLLDDLLYYHDIYIVKEYIFHATDGDYDNKVDAYNKAKERFENEKKHFLMMVEENLNILKIIVKE